MINIMFVLHQKLKGMDANGLCDSFCQVTLVANSTHNMVNVRFLSIFSSFTRPFM